MVVNAENKAEARMVKAEQSIVDKWVVTEGLAAGDRVIVEGLQKVKPGMPVQAQEAGSAAAVAPPTTAATVK
jgi:membrane fusion protein (multidrug efflux system)